MFEIFETLTGMCSLLVLGAGATIMVSGLGIVDMIYQIFH